MRAYVIRRFLLMIPTFILVTLTIFCLLRTIPGDVIDLMVAESGGAGGGEMTRDDLKRALGLDEAIYIQYLRYMAGIFRGDFGTHIWDRTPILDDILHRLPVSFELGALALVTAMIIALPIGIFSAIRQAYPRHTLYLPSHLLDRDHGGRVPFGLVGLGARGGVHSPLR
jgi:peptide/nickel transport system permease protein